MSLAVFGKNRYHVFCLYVIIRLPNGLSIFIPFYKEKKPPPCPKARRE
jgi:hypothetical protein